MAEAPNPFLQQPDEGNVNLLGDMFGHVAPQPAAANGNPGRPLPHLAPAYANLGVAVLQAAAAQGLNLFGAPLPQSQDHPAGNDDDIHALQAADANNARRRAPGRNGRARDAGGNGNGGRDAGRNGSGSANGEERHSATGAETFADIMTKAKSVLTQPFVFTSLVYSLVISFSLSVRGNKMSLVNGRPVDSVGHTFLPGPDKWVTTGAIDVVITCVAFLVILMTHFYLISHLRMKRPAGAPAMQRYYACFIPVTLTLATELYYLSYVSLSRYAVDNIEWIILGIFSAILICGSMNIIICPPIRQDQVVVYGACPCCVRVSAE